MFEDDFPFPKVGYVNSLEGSTGSIFPNRKKLRQNDGESYLVRGVEVIRVKAADWKWKWRFFFGGGGGGPAKKKNVGFAKVLEETKARGSKKWRGLEIPSIENPPT